MPDLSFFQEYLPTEIGRLILLTGVMNAIAMPSILSGCHYILLSDIIHIRITYFHHTEAMSQPRTFIRGES